MALLLVALAMASHSFSTPPGTSYYPARLNDPHAVYLEAPADGVQDATAAIQRAIDQVQDTRGEGIVFVPSGRYRLSDTIQVWAGIRLIGFGATRPTFLLGPKTFGYEKVEKLMVFFAGQRSRDKKPFDLSKVSGVFPDLGYPGDANPGTFYSAMSNVDLEIAEGNPGAVGVRAKYAQHCFLSHMDFRLGTALAGMHETGNIAEDLRFFGGQHGIITRTPSPGWPFTLVDSTFEGQTGSAIRTLAAGLTLIRPTFRNVPTAVEVEPDSPEYLWMSDARVEDVSGPAVVISREKSLRTQINVQNVACRNVPTFAQFRESGTKIAGKGGTYAVTSFSHGLTYADLGLDPEIATRYQAKALASMPSPVATDHFPLPPAGTWVNLATLGAKGDGETDDTAVLKAAIAKYPTIYLPTGKYRVTEPIRLRPDTVLIGLHPFTTQILIKDRTPAFSGIPEAAPANQGGFRPSGSPFPGNPVALIEAPKGGRNIVTGIGLDTGGNNVGAVAAKWMAGASSMMQDVKFLGGHGSVPWSQIYNADRSGDPDPSRRWDSQYPSLWVTDGGGGTFTNIWTASPFASSGMLVSNTNTEGRVYEMSSEHHVRNEVQVRNASNWKFYALQLEEERGEGSFALPIEVDNSSNILFANTNIYRVIAMAQPFPYAMKVSGSSDVRIRGVHCNSNSKASFDSLLHDATYGGEARNREIAVLDVTGKKPRTQKNAAKVTKLVGGFHNISGGAVDAQGDPYFVDARFQRIHKWDATNGGLTTVLDYPLQPINLAFDLAGNLIVVSTAGKGMVFSFKPGQEEIAVLKAEKTTPQAGKRFVIPVTDWELNRDLVAGKPWSHEYLFRSLDGSTFLPADQDFLDGGTSWGVKAQAIIRSFGLAVAKPGDTVYTMGENNLRTYSAKVDERGSLTDGKLFAEQGGEGLAVDSAGNVYIGAGQVFVYDPSGKLVRTIRVPERPIQLMFGGPDGKTLFIAARTSLYSVRP